MDPILLQDVLLAGGSSSFIGHILITAVAVMAAAYILDGVHVDSFVTALIVAVVLAILNATIGRFLEFIFTPITWLTLGLFRLVIGGFVIYLTENLVKGFRTRSFMWAIGVVIVVAIVSGFLDKVL